MKNLDILERAHEHISSNKDEIRFSAFCACVYCKATRIPTVEVAEWIDEGRTAKCPRCGIDSLIGSLAPFPCNDEHFMDALHERWFSIENAVSAKDLKRQGEDVLAAIARAAHAASVGTRDLTQAVLLVKGKALDFPIANMRLEEVQEGLAWVLLMARVIKNMRTDAG